MHYRVSHTTEYLYSAQVSHCYNLAHIIPRTSARQKCLSSDVSIQPVAAYKSVREDYFGNKAYHFEIQRSHEKLVLIATSHVDTRPQLVAEKLADSPSYSDVAKLVKYAKDAELIFAREFLLESPMIKANQALLAYAQDLFEPQKPVLMAVMELTQRIYQEFTYCPQATTIATPLEEVLKEKKGVCQDFAHLQIGCLRALGIPAKYVSGYIETLPPPGQEKLVGSDASHAWVSVYCPAFGWVEFDPTNNCLVSEQHILTAWGRDYYDVTPLKGVIFGGGSAPSMNVCVDVARV